MKPPRMLGFGIHSLDKYRPMLLNAGWTLVIVSERPNTPGRKTLRDITEIVSAATFEDNNDGGYTLASLYLEPVPI
jgi:hypothetical protein